MAQRSFSQFRYSNKKQVYDIYGQFSVGASGAPTLASNIAVKSVVRNSAGNYTITFTDAYFAFLMFQAAFKNSSGIEASPNVGIIAVSVTNPATINFVMSTGGVATDPASGDVVYFQATFNNSSAI